MRKPPVTATPFTYRLAEPLLDSTFTQAMYPAGLESAQLAKVVRCHGPDFGTDKSLGAGEASRCANLATRTAATSAPKGVPETPISGPSSAPCVANASVHRYVTGSRLARSAYSLRTESPSRSMRWAPCTMRSQIASAMVGSPITSCQDDTGSCDTIKVEARP